MADEMVRGRRLGPDFMLFTPLLRTESAQEDDSGDAIERLQERDAVIRGVRRPVEIAPRAPAFGAFNEIKGRVSFNTVTPSGVGQIQIVPVAIEYSVVKRPELVAFEHIVFFGDVNGFGREEAVSLGQQ